MRAQEAAFLGRAAPPAGQRSSALNLEPQVIGWAERFAPKHHALFLGRGMHYPIALEGALKLKSGNLLSHAEAYPAGELKHGPLALVDEAMPVVVIAPNDACWKVKSNIRKCARAAADVRVRRRRQWSANPSRST